MVVGERYRLDRELGIGGSATVWLAHDLFADSPCAVKWLLPDERGGPSRRERMRGEVQALASLVHPHVVRVNDVGEHEGRDFLVMDYISAGSLADRIDRQGPLAPAHATELVLQVLDALGAAHAAGIVHRDVKPANVLLRGEHDAVLCDFGIARSDEIGGATRTGMALGSVGFMAPEQRVDARRVGPPADLYAVACTLFNLVTGETPIDLYLAPDHSPRWEGVPAPLRPVLRKATRVGAEDRYHDAAEMAAALHDVLPSLRSLTPIRRISADATPSHAPTRIDEALLTLDAERRNTLGSDDWGWANRRTAVGRTAVWVGVAAVGLATGVGVVLGPMSGASAVPSAPVIAPAVLPELQGSWVGSLGASKRADLVLSGTSEHLTGEMVVRLGQHQVRSRVQGTWDPVANVLVLEDTSVGSPAVWRARMTPSGLALEGDVSRPGSDTPLPFAFVRME